MTDDETRRTLAQSPRSRPLAIVLRASCPSKPALLSLASGQVVVGSGSRCGLVLEDETVSRNHVELRLVPEGVEIEDLGSRNGTFYLGQRIARATLAPGTRVQLGQVTLTIDLDAATLGADAVPLSASFRGMVGAAGAMRRLFNTISRLDGSLVPVLIQGESGVGKELVARAIHEGSRVSSGPYVPVNCGAIARELVASTLFGHRRGAFTGAIEGRQGAFATAEGGTLLLDEIGELPLEVQPALLRVLETGEVTPVGDDRPRPAPAGARARVITSTHRSLPDLVRRGLLREDLYYRLAVVTLPVPALRERREDIASLARLFARSEGAADLDDEVLEELSLRDFPGNVRELRNAVLAYVALGSLSAPGQDPLGASAPGAPPSSPGEDRVPLLDTPYYAQRDIIVDAFTRRYLKILMDHTGGNQSEAARIAGLDRTYLGRLLTKLGVGRGKAS